MSMITTPGPSSDPTKKGGGMVVEAAPSAAGASAGVPLPWGAGAQLYVVGRVWLLSFVLEKTAGQ